MQTKGKGIWVLTFLGFGVALWLMICAYAWGAIYIDPSVTDPAEDGSLEHPYNSWKDFSINVTSRDYYQKYGTTYTLPAGTGQAITVLSTGDGASDDYTILGAYGDANLAKPIIIAQHELPGWTDPNNWTNKTGNIWWIDTNAVFWTHPYQNPKRVWIDSNEYAPCSDANDVDVVYRWSYNETTDKLHLWSDTNKPNYNYTSILGCQGIARAISLEGASYVEVKDFDIRGGYFQGVNIVFSDHCLIYDNTISLGTSGILLGARGTSPYTASTYVEIYDNTIDGDYEVIDTELSYISDGVKLYRAVNNSKVYKNTILDWVHGCVTLINDSTTYSGVIDNEVYENEITGTNADDLRGFGCSGIPDPNDVSNNTCRNNKIYRNRIHDFSVKNQFNCSGCDFIYNLIYDIQNRSSQDNQVGQGFELSAWAGTGSCINNTIANNTIYNCDEAGLTAYYNSSVLVQDNIIANNIISNCGVNSNTGRDNIAIYVANSSNVGNTWRNNIIYGADPNAVSYLGSVMNISTFNNQNDPNNDTIIRNVFGDPKFRDTANSNFAIQLGGHAKDAGYNLGSDYDGAIMQGSTWPDGVTTESQNLDPRWDSGAIRFPQRGGGVW